MSGVKLSKKWVSELPEDWNWVRASHIVNPVNRPVISGDEIVTCFRDGEVTLRSNRRTDGFTVSLKEIGYQHIERGDLVIHSMDGGWGAIGVSDSDGKASPVVHAYKTPSNDVYFLAYVLRAMAYSGYLLAQTKGIRERSTQFDKNSFFNLYLPLPDLDTQRRIAEYLDTEVGEMDAMAARLETLIADLEARRKTVITEKVTGRYGNDDGAGYFPMRKLGLLVTLLQSNVDKKSADDEIPVELCNYTDVYYNDTISTDMSFMKVTATEQQISRLGLRVGDVVITKDSETADDIGIPSYVSSTHPSLVCGYHLSILRSTKSALHSKFLYYVMLSRDTTSYWEKEANGVTRVSIPGTTVSSLQIPLPDLDTQRRIAAELDEETAAIDGIITRSRTLIDDLKARKSALITEVVTGRKQV